MKHKMSGLHFSNRVLLCLLLTGSLLACGSSDNINNDNEDVVDIGVTNTAPIANAGNDQNVFIGSAVLLNGELSSDTDGDEISYVWNMATLPSGSLVSLSNETTVSPSFTPDVVGSYVLELAVNDGELTSTVDSIEVLVSSVIAGTTEGVLCDYDYNEFNDSPSVSYTSSAQWTCVDGMRELVANGIPDHEVGTFPNASNPNSIEAQTISDSMTLSPNETSTATELGGPRGVTGYVLNGVKIDAGTAGSCDDSGNDCSLIDNSGSWSIEALGHTSFNFGTDDNNAHVQPGGTYHYHGMPEGFIEKQGGDNSKMTLIGWAADGFPIYARYGYTIASDASSGIKNITGSYQLVTEVSSSRPSTDVYALGTFAQDWQYVEDSGDLDQCNGRVGVTPEFPQGIYHYFATDTYPYFLRCVKGEVEAAAGGPPPRF